MPQIPPPDNPGYREQVHDPFSSPFAVRKETFEPRRIGVVGRFVRDSLSFDTEPDDPRGAGVHRVL